MNDLLEKCQWWEASPLTPALSPLRGEGDRDGVSSVRGANARIVRTVVFVFAFIVVGSAGAATLSESFATDPLTHGWRTFGDASLFHWNSTNQNLEVTWDSSRTNSYFAVPLNTIIAKSDDFSFSFDARFSSIAAGVRTNQPSSFPLSIGFQSWTNATATNFYRGSGHNSPNLVEFAYYPDTGFGDTVWPTVWFTNSQLSYVSDNDYTLISLPIGVWTHVSMRFAASNQTVTTTITTNGVSIGAIHDVKLFPTNRDFRVDTFAIESYSEAAQDPQFGGSLLAHGIIDNVALTIPAPPAQNMRGAFTNNAWQVQFTARTNFSYALERTSNFVSWAASVTSTNTNSASVTLLDTNAAPAQFYRVRARHL